MELEGIADQYSVAVPMVVLLVAAMSALDDESSMGDGHVGEVPFESCCRGRFTAGGFRQKGRYRADPFAAAW